MIIIAYLLSFLCLILNLSLFVRFKPPYSFFIWPLQLAAGALSPFLVLAGLLGAVFGWLRNTRKASRRGSRTCPG